MNNRSRPAKPKQPQKQTQKQTQKPQPLRQPGSLPFLAKICQKLNQRVNLEDEQRLLGVYERGWIFKGVLGNLEGDEAKYVKALATKYNSWIARQVA